MAKHHREWEHEEHGNRIAGATFWIQAWSRDPGDAFGDSLSNALSAVVCP